MIVTFILLTMIGIVESDVSCVGGRRCGTQLLETPYVE